VTCAEWVGVAAGVFVKVWVEGEGRGWGRAVTEWGSEWGEKQFLTSPSNLLPSLSSIQQLLFVVLGVVRPFTAGSENKVVVRVVSKLPEGGTSVGRFETRLC
jgi:hypothetical protein